MTGRHYWKDSTAVQSGRCKNKKKDLQLLRVWLFLLNRPRICTNKKSVFHSWLSFKFFLYIFLWFYSITEKNGVSHLFCSAKYTTSLSTSSKYLKRTFYIKSNKKKTKESTYPKTQTCIPDWSPVNTFFFNKKKKGKPKTLAANKVPLSHDR